MSEKNNNHNSSDKREKIKGIIKETVETVVIVLVLVIFIRSVIGEPRWIPSSSMEPTLQIGDNLIIEKLTGFFSEPERGDIVVFYPPQNDLDPTLWGKFTRLIGFFSKDEAFIKRIIGLPGDEIEIEPGVGVFVNSVLINEPYKKDVSRIPCEPDMFCGPLIVPEGQYYMLGDNRNDSRDSRYWGFLPENRIVGKAFFRFWPVTRISLIEQPEYNLGEPEAASLHH